MRPCEKIPKIGVKYNEFQEHRVKELRTFWESGEKYAELETQGTVTMPRERTLYARAATKLRIPWYEIKFHQRGDSLFIERLFKGEE